MNLFMYTMLIVTCMTISSCHSAPVTDLPTGEPWKTPCSGTAPTRAPLFTIPTQPPGSVTTRLTSLILKTIDAVEICNSIQNQIKVLLNSNDMINYLEQFDSLQGFPTLTSEKKSLKENLKTDYEKFVQIYIFLEQSFQDSEFKTDFQRLGSKVLNILCELKIISSSLQQEIISNVTRDIMPPSYRELNLAKRTDRDYIMVRDIIKILQATQLLYNSHISGQLA